MYTLSYQFSSYGHTYVPKYSSIQLPYVTFYAVAQVRMSFLSALLDCVILTLCFVTLSSVTDTMMKPQTHFQNLIMYHLASALTLGDVDAFTMSYHY